MAQTIREVMTPNPVSVAVDATARDAAQAMRDSEIGDVIVIDESDEVLGIVTDRDLALRVVAEGRSPAETVIGDICSQELHSLSPEDSVGDAVKLMTGKSVRRLPVIEGGRPVGIVSLGDLAQTQDPESALADISAAPPNS